MKEIQTRSDRRRQAAQAAILDAAERRFMRQGYHRTKMHEIAMDADVSVGSIYTHFERKEGLYAALLERASEVEETYVGAVFASDIPDAVKIFAVGEAYLSFFRDHPAYFRMLVFPHDDVPLEAVKMERGITAALRGEVQNKRMAEVIRTCQQQGIIRDTINPERASTFMWGAWNGVVALTLRPDLLRLSEEDLPGVIQEGRIMLAEGIASALLREGGGLGLKPEFTPPLESLEKATSQPSSMPVS